MSGDRPLRPLPLPLLLSLRHCAAAPRSDRLTHEVGEGVVLHDRSKEVRKSTQ